VDAAGAIPCVIYAAKSTEDKRGSIPEQLRECREAIEADPRRRFLAQYIDEAFSAYRRDRGPGLRDATEHAEDLAAQHGIAELWAQHSDRIARGDGRAARHTVEIALWALKHDVRVRTLQDPDTFRDLLYAVVTGQRNNEDSRRKAVSSQAGRKRAIARGEFVAHLPDGYRLHRELDEAGKVHKRLEIDPQRRELFELLFRLALRGRSCGQIARTLNDRGWLTKPVRRIDHPRPFDVGKVYDLLQNPRYAALSTYRGEVLARGHWPAYISERQHERIKARLERPRQGYANGPAEAFLLRGLARCGHCAAPLRALTRRAARDGSRSRAYVCASHRSLRGRAQCKAPPIDAHVAEAMLIACLPALLELDGPRPSCLEASSQRAPVESSGQPQAEEGTYAALAAHVLGSQRRARELAELARLRSWIEREAQGRTEATRAHSEELARLLASWFQAISIRVTAMSVVIAARRHNAEGRAPASVRIERAAWSRLAPAGHRQLARRNAWERAETIGALQAWADRHGQSPRPPDWKLASKEHPSAPTVCNQFGSWRRALHQAGLAPQPSTAPYSWEPAQLLEALRRWTRLHRRVPRSMQWAHAQPGYPSAGTVRAHFGHFADALHAAGLQAEPRRPYTLHYWRGQEILQSLRAWTQQHGRPPRAIDWICAGAGRPCSSTVRNHFPSWEAALAAAGLEADERS
jgi:recombinase/HNH endonuclease/recombinase-like zinc beta ribbon protein/resolvase-like protein